MEQKITSVLKTFGISAMLGVEVVNTVAMGFGLSLWKAGPFK